MDNDNTQDLTTEEWQNLIKLFSNHVKKTKKVTKALNKKGEEENGGKKTS